MQQIPNIVKIEGNDCNSKTVEVASDVSDESIKKTEGKPKRKRKQQNEKIKKHDDMNKNSKVIVRLIQKK